MPGPGDLSCGRCALLVALSHVVKELKEEVNRLCVIRENEKEVE